MRLLDLFCKAGGASMGYYRAGFEVVGVDIEPQPNYPFEFFRWDAVEFLVEADLSSFDAIAASPPCQDHSVLSHSRTSPHGSAYLLAETREALIRAGKPYVIENVVGAPMVNPVTLCGTMFDLGAKCRDGWRHLRRHRLFEASFKFEPPGPCNHVGYAVGVYGGGPSPRGERRANGNRSGGYQGLTSERIEAMGIDWMARNELSQAIPPAYTEYVGRCLMDYLEK